MGLIKIIQNNGVSGEAKGDAFYVDGDSVATAEMTGALVLTLTMNGNLDTVTITVSGGAGTPPSQEDILAAWESVLVNAKGSVCTLTPAPQLYNTDNGNAIYPAIAVT